MDGQGTLATSDMPRTVSRELAEQASKVVEEAEDSCKIGLEIVIDETRRIPLPSDLGDFILNVITATSRNGIVSIRSMPEDLTTSVAASELGISRPTLMKLIRSGDLKSHKVGTHTRVKHEDVVKYRRRRESERQRAVESMFEAFDSAGDS